MTCQVRNSGSFYALSGLNFGENIKIPWLNEDQNDIFDSYCKYSAHVDGRHLTIWGTEQPDMKFEYSADF